MSNKYNIEYLIKAKDSLYLEVECSIAEDIDCAIQWAINRIKQLEDANEELINRDNVDEHNFGAHMMAKQILKSLKHSGEGGFGEPLANEIIQMFKQLEEENEKYVNAINDWVKSEEQWLDKVKQLEDVLWAKDQLLIGYRIGKQPPEKAFNIIDKYKESLEEK